MEKGIDVGLANRVNRKNFNHVAVNSCHAFLDSNEFNSGYIIDGPRSPKLVDIINIILYLWVGYIMQETKQALNLSSFQKFWVLILLAIFSLQIYREARCYHSGVQADWGIILTSASIITRAVLREDSHKEREIHMTFTYIPWKARFSAICNFKKRRNHVLS